MRKFAVFVACIGLILVVGTAMIAFEQVATDERRADIRQGINAQLDSGAQSYEQSREDGCRRRCGFFGSMSHMVVGLRDGIFLSMPFDPETVFPPAPDGWVRTEYTLAAMQDIVDWEMYRSAVFQSTQNSLLMRFDDIASANNVGAVRIYQQGDKRIAMAIMIHRNGLRAAKGEGRNGTVTVENPIAIIDGLPVRAHAQEAYEGFGNDPTPVAYRHLSMNIDGQVSIAWLALSEEADLMALLSGFDLAPIVQDLPQIPAGYTAGTGLVGPSIAAEREDG